MTPARFNVVVATILIVGVVMSAALIILAVVGAIAVGWQGSLDGRAPVGGDATDFGAMVQGLAALRPIAIAQLGLVVLLATPMLRVGAAVVGFVRQRDIRFAAISLGVFAILMIGLVAPTGR